MRPSLEVADIFRHYGPHYRQTHGAALSQAHRRVMRSIAVCRTAACGGHVERWTPRHQRIMLIQSGRHCPNVSPSHAPTGWKAARGTAETEYFHVVSRSARSPIVPVKRVVYNLVPANGDLAYDCGGPEASGCGDRLLAVCIPGPNLVPPSAPPLCRPRRDCPRWDRWVACRPGFFPSARAGALACFGACFGEFVQACMPGQLEFAGLCGTHDPQSFAAYLGAGPKARGSSMRRNPSAVHNACWITWDATRIG
jgi:hypothetical protein